MTAAADQTGETKLGLDPGTAQIHLVVLVWTGESSVVVAACTAVVLPALRWKQWPGTVQLKILVQSKEHHL